MTWELKILSYVIVAVAAIAAFFYIQELQEYRDNLKGLQNANEIEEKARSKSDDDLLDGLLRD